MLKALVIIVKNVNFVELKICVDEIIEIENKKIRLKLDTGADISVIPKEIFQKMDTHFKIRNTGCIIKGFEGTKAKTEGIVNLLCKYKDNSIYEDFVIIEGATKVLLGGQACVNLGLVKRVNKVELRKHK